ncbi:DegV family protein [Actinokineospora bangkokensis]|uniref:Fatty acid-binding protein DegV n=1 Tax=Actinokineospora bangkokensis TaxID=1193682 RepID=A0A1Q9LHX0_9PSEU|nr:DegV family protein [Actinokineospora bangkokensis]OLR91642.1 fatty acid-binding protein DegV [Actinokineospora bangkokensis]
MRVAIVTDSTSSLPPEVARQWGIRVIPIRIHVADQVDDERRIPPAAVVEAMRGALPVSTEPPPPAAFYWAYRAAAEDGADAVVSVHISAKQSTTVEHAREAAAQLRFPVEVVDSGNMGMTMGYAVTGAARVAGAGGSPARVIDTLQRRLGASTTLIHVETLDYLRAGGRIGAAAHLIGSALSVKPLLTIKDGQVAPTGRSLGTGRAVRKLVDLAAEAAGDRTVDVAVEHVGAPEQANTVLEGLRKAIPDIRETIVTEASTAIAVHTGPGTLCVHISGT